MGEEYNFDFLETQAKRYNISNHEIFIIMINLFGIASDEVNCSRVRFKLYFTHSDIEQFFAVSVNTSNTPFFLESNKLWYDQKVIGIIYHFEEDTCTNSYFRRNKTALTLNSNCRSTCSGCEFCGTYSLIPDDLYNLNNYTRLKDYLLECIYSVNQKDFSKIKYVTVVSGCFCNEFELLKHLIQLYEVLESLEFSGIIGYLGFQLQTYDELSLLIKKIPFFDYIFTLECFEQRDTLLKTKKMWILKRFSLFYRRQSR